MDFTTEQIERVVREVLAEMKRAPVSPAVSTPVAKPKNPPIDRKKPSVAEQDGTLVVNSRVVTLAEVADRLPGKRRLVVRPGAVVTPAVRDALRQRNVVLEFTAAAANSGGCPPARLVLIAVLTRFDVQSLAAALSGDGRKPVCHLRDCLISATDLLAEELAERDSLMVLLTPHASAALCLANRRPGVRAILAEDLQSLSRDVEAVGANVLIVNPKKVGRYPIQRMVETFRAGGVRPCPKVFENQLA
jgi:hypothetical protein